jgi:hypothetical protein
VAGGPSDRRPSGIGEHDSGADWGGQPTLGEVGRGQAKPDNALDLRIHLRTALMAACALCSHRSGQWKQHPLGVGEASKWHVVSDRGHVLWPAGPSQNLIMPNTRQESEAQAAALRAGASCERTMSGDQLSGQVRCRDRILHNPVGLRTYPTNSIRLLAVHRLCSTVPRHSRARRRARLRSACRMRAERCTLAVQTTRSRPVRTSAYKAAALLSELHRRETTAKLAETRAACANRV